MKNKGLILTLILLIFPLAVMGESAEHQKLPSQKEPTQNTVSKDENDSILVFSPLDNKTQDIDMFEYTVGAVAAEIPPTYHTEAVKAQAVTAYTYALKVRSQGKRDEINGAHISALSEKHQGYIDIEE